MTMAVMKTVVTVAGMELDRLEISSVAIDMGKYYEISSVAIDMGKYY